MMHAVPEREPARQFYFMELARDLVRDASLQAGRPLTYFVKTFGCQMNARDSEKLRGILEAIGYEPGADEHADLVLYNTCTVRENANLKVYGRLGSVKGDKRRNPFKRIALCGCMMQEPQVIEEIRTHYAYVDLVFGTHNIYRLAELLCRVLAEDGPVIEIFDEAKEIVESLPIERTYPFKSGVNIMFGCNNFCSYCIVPYVRGRERSRPSSEILSEIRHLVDDGVVEVMLLGQNVNSYHDDGTGFPELLDQVASVDGLARVRFMTSHPKDLSADLIDVMARHENICDHLHLPLQSGSTRILEQMNRRYTKESYLELVDRIRNGLPDISITTDIIVGFPGETEQDFLETIDVVERVRFDGAFTFLYSRRNGTPAARMDDQIPDAIRKDRFDRLLALVQKIGSERCDRFAGRTLPVLVESLNEQDDRLVTGRLPSNTIVHFPGDASMIGTVRRVRLDQCCGFYYMGTSV